jgi:hypothetical protein
MKPNYPLVPSFPRRRESSKTNTPCSGQNRNIVPLMKRLAIRLMKLLANPLSHQTTVTKWLVISWQKTPAKSLVTRGDYSINWIPACAGMTRFRANG